MGHRPPSVSSTYTFNLHFPRLAVWDFWVRASEKFPVLQSGLNRILHRQGLELELTPQACWPGQSKDTHRPHPQVAILGSLLLGKASVNPLDSWNHRPKHLLAQSSDTATMNALSRSSVPNGNGGSLQSPPRPAPVCPTSQPHHQDPPMFLLPPSERVRIQLPRIVRSLSSFFFASASRNPAANSQPERWRQHHARSRLSKPVSRRVLDRGVHKPIGGSCLPDPVRDGPVGEGLHYP